MDAEVLETGGSLENAKAVYAEMYPEAKFAKSTFGGKTAYKMTATRYDSNGDAINITGYIFMHGEKAYAVYTSIKEVYETAFNKTRLDNIIRSFKVI